MFDSMFDRFFLDMIIDWKVKDMGFVDEVKEQSLKEEEETENEDEERDEESVEICALEYIKHMESKGITVLPSPYENPIGDTSDSGVGVNDEFAFIQICHQVCSMRTVWCTRFEKGDEPSEVRFQFCSDRGVIFSCTIDENLDFEDFMNRLKHA